MYKFTDEEKVLDSVDVLEPIEVKPFFVVRFTKLGWGLYLDMDDRPVLFHNKVSDERELRNIRNNVKTNTSTLFNDCYTIETDKLIFRYSYEMFGEDIDNYKGFTTIAISRQNNLQHLCHINIGFKKFKFNGNVYYDYYIIESDLTVNEKEFKVKQATIRIP